MTTNLGPMVKQSFSLLRLGCALLAIPVVVAVSGCSSSASGDDDANAPTTKLDGVYTATSGGPFAWISFFGDSNFTLLRSDAGCDAEQIPASCMSVGTYTVDSTSKTLRLHDGEAGTTTSYPMSIAEGLAAGLTDDLTTQDQSLVGNSGGGGSLVSSGGSLTTTENVSLTQSNGTSQSLVSSKGSLVSCPSTAAAQQSSQASNCSMSSSGGSDVGDGRIRHALIGQVCTGAIVACKMLFQIYAQQGVDKLVMPTPAPSAITMTGPKP